MPLLPLDNEPRTFDPAQPGIRIAPVGDQPLPSPGFAPTVGAAFRQSNEVASFLSSRDVSTADRYRIEEGFDLFKSLKDDGIEENEDAFLDVFNAQAYAARKAQVEMEAEDRHTLDAAGFWGDLWSFGAAVASPTMALPGGQIYRGVKGGYALGKSALSVGAAAAGAASVSEAALHATQQLRTPAESAFAIGGSALLGGLLGTGAAKFLNGMDRRVLSRKLDDLARSDAPDEQFANEGEIADLFGPQSAGAAIAPKDTVGDLTIAGRAAGAVGKASAMARLNPLVRLLDSPSAEARTLATGTMETPVYLRKNMEGSPSELAVETLVKEYSQGATARVMQAQDAQYKAFRKSGGKLNKTEFRQAVGKAMRRGDRSNVPEIANVAADWRAKVFDPLKEQAIEAGMLPKDVKVDTAESYFSRLWNWRNIESNEAKFKAIVTKYIDGEISRAEVGATDKFVSKADREAYVSEIADEVYNRITGRMEGDLPRDIVPTRRGPLKDRTFHIPDHLVEDFIESDVELVGRRYARIMAAEVELAKKYGSPDMKEALKRVQDQYAELRKAIEPSDKNAAKQLKALNDREKADMRDLKAVRDMLRGTYLAKENASVWARALGVANTLNYLRAMGGVMISSLTDVARPMMVHGLGRYMGQGIKPLVTNLKAVKMSVREARLAGAVAERILNTRMATWAEIADPYSVSSPFERFLENTSKNFSKLNGMVYWNDFMKSFAATMTQTRILESTTGFAGINKREKAYLAFLGIDESMAQRISKQFDEFGMTEGGVHIAGTEDWTDLVARRAYRAAMNKDVDSIIVTKGIGDVPLFAHTPTGRAVLQFKSFALASHQRAFMRGLQEAPAGVISGMMMATTVGMLIYWLKSVESNRADDLSDNPGRWLAEGLDRSGMFSVMFEVNNTMEKAFGTGAYAALSSAFPDKDQSGKASRYAVRSTAATFAGPTGDFVDTLVKVVAGMKDGDLKESDVNAIRRLAPGGTLPGIRSILEYGVMPKAREAVAD